MFSSRANRHWHAPTQRRAQQQRSSWSGSSLLILILLILTLLLSLVPAPAAATRSESPRVLPSLLEEGRAYPDRLFRVIVQRKGRASQADEYVTRALDGRKGKEVFGNGFVAYLPGRALDELGRHGAVKYVSPDAEMISTTTATTVSATNLGQLYPQTVSASSLWAEGITGANVGVAVIDTGITSSHPDFLGADGRRVVAQQVFNANTTSTDDGYGHGTHVAGIVGGNSWHQSDTTLQGKYIGIAPQADIINLKVADDAGNTHLSDVVNAIEWVINNKDTYNIRVLNLSMVSSVAESYTTNILDAACEMAWTEGILVVIAAGNLGADTLLYPPANDPFVLTVGAVDQMGTVAKDDDTIAWWSSHGVTQDGFSKPDVVAPGRYITSVLADPSTHLGQGFPGRVVDETYIWLSGTSMAAPVVSGIAALAFQAHPEWTNDQVKWLLMETAQQLGSTDSSSGAFIPEIGQGAGEVDAAAVVHYSGTPSLANQNLTVSSQITLSDGSLTYDASVSSTSSSWSSSSWSNSEDG